MPQGLESCARRGTRKMRAKHACEHGSLGRPRAVPHAHHQSGRVHASNYNEPVIALSGAQPARRARRRRRALVPVHRRVVHCGMYARDPSAPEVGLRERIRRCTSQGGRSAAGVPCTSRPCCARPRCASRRSPRSARRAAPTTFCPVVRVQRSRQPHLVRHAARSSRSRGDSSCTGHRRLVPCRARGWLSHTTAGALRGLLEHDDLGTEVTSLVSDTSPGACR